MTEIDFSNVSDSEITTATQLLDELECCDVADEELAMG